MVSGASEPAEAREAIVELSYPFLKEAGERHESRLFTGAGLTNLNRAVARAAGVLALCEGAHSPADRANLLIARKAEMRDDDEGAGRVPGLAIQCTPGADGGRAPKSTAWSRRVVEAYEANLPLMREVEALLADTNPDFLKVLTRLFRGSETLDKDGKVISTRAPSGFTHQLAWGRIDGAAVDPKLAHLRRAVEVRLARAPDPLLDPTRIRAAHTARAHT